MTTINIATNGREQIVDITAKVQDAVSRAGVAHGAAIVCVLHTTAGITINENADPDVASDIVAALSRLAPRTGRYDHVEGNADAHVKSTLVGQSVTVPIEDGRLQLGTWQGIHFCEFDGPRQRRVAVQLLSGS